MTTHTLPYIARYPWWMKTLAIFSLCFVLYMLVFELPEVIIYWNTHHWIVRALMVILYLGIVPLGFMQIFLERTKFGVNGIEHRNGFGITRTYSYFDVNFFEYLEGKSLKIYFSDQKSINLWIGVANSEQVMQLIEEYGDRPVPLKVIWNA